ncbi:MAG: ABC transporter ATP-binding protein [Ruminococcaceae bacterium]|nr:ABC transporter ATP-binding protein [Oscillospiraceae bacterium]
MKVLFRVMKEAAKYKWLLIVAAISTLALTGVNLIAPKILTDMTETLTKGVDEAALRQILLMAFSLLGLYLLKILFRFLSNYLAHKAAWNLVQDVRMKVYNRIQSFSMGFFHNRQTGELMSRVVNDTAQFEYLYAHLMPDTVTNIITLVGVTAIIFAINAKLALLTCIPIPFILVASWIFAHKIRPNFRITQRSLATLNAQLQDNFSGIQEIQAFNQQEKESGHVLDKAKTYTRYMLRALKQSAVYHPAVEFLTSLGNVIVIGFGGYLAFRMEVDFADIVAFLFYLSLFYAPITQLANLIETAQQALAGVERVVEILDTPCGIEDAPDAYDLPPISGQISFEDLSFSYVEESPVLKDVDFTVEPGQMVALVGPTGVGKSTLTQLIGRFYDPTSGRVTMDGHDIRKVKLESLRQQIAMVLQDTFLFNGTVGENIAYARPSATPEEIAQAAKSARIYDDIMAMPDGFDTMVGERGTRLSGGQKQRIAIARAILRGSPILILDEATASVDVETEAHIQQAINELAGRRTIVAIAHRLSTIRRADVILVFHEGRIVQRGTHEELIAQDGIYRRMWQVQELSARAV